MLFHLCRAGHPGRDQKAVPGRRHRQGKPLPERAGHAGAGSAGTHHEAVRHRAHPLPTGRAAGGERGECGHGHPGGTARHEPDPGGPGGCGTSAGYPGGIPGGSTGGSHQSGRGAPRAPGAGPSADPAAVLRQPYPERDRKGAAYHPGTDLPAGA